MVRAVCLAMLLAAAPAQAIETMRIAMAGGQRSLIISAQTLSFGSDADEATFTAISGGRAEVRLRSGRLELNGSPLVEKSVRLRSGEWALDAGVPGDQPLRVGELTVRGDLVVTADRGALRLVNVLPLEDYLVGVLGSEMPKSFPPEALKAQAVAARTYALQKKLVSNGDGAHLGSSVLSQVYGGLSAEDPRTRAAVEATRGLVLTFDLAPIEAYFHASCGGRTATGLEALGRDLPYLKSVECPCGRLPVSRWELSLADAELGAALGRRGPPQRVRVLTRSSSGRARLIALAPGKQLDAVTFRELLGYTKVKSLAFEIEDGHDGLSLTGRGYGHGAGLCQWGANALAQEGWDFRKILEHYYPGTELQVLY